jgi:hypothetical protein
MVKHRLQLQYSNIQNHRSVNQKKEKKDGTGNNNYKKTVTNLGCGEILLVLLPFAFDAIPRFGAIAGFLFGGLVSIILFDSLLGEIVSKPVRILLERCWIVESVGVWGSTSSRLERGVTAAGRGRVSILTMICTRVSR